MADRHFNQFWPDLTVEPIAIHAEVSWCITMANQPGQKNDGGLHGSGK